MVLEKTQILIILMGWLWVQGAQHCSCLNVGMAHLFHQIIKSKHDASISKRAVLRLLRHANPYQQSMQISRTGNWRTFKPRTSVPRRRWMSRILSDLDMYLQNKVHRRWRIHDEGTFVAVNTFLD